MQLRNRRKNHILFNVFEYVFESPLLLLELMICKQIHSYTGKYSTPLAVKILYDSMIIAIMWGNIVISGKSWSHGNSNQSWSMIYRYLRKMCGKFDMMRQNQSFKSALENLFKNQNV